MIGKRAGAIERARHVAGHRRRAIHRGNYSDEVAGADLAAWPEIAFKGGAQLRRQDFIVLGGFGEMVITGEIMKTHVVDMNMAARLGRPGGEGADLAGIPVRLPASRLGG